MDNLTVVIPCFNGENYIHNLLSDLPVEIAVVIVDDHSDEPLSLRRANTTIYDRRKKAISPALSITPLHARRAMCWYSTRMYG